MTPVVSVLGFTVGVILVLDSMCDSCSVCHSSYCWHYSGP